MSKVAVKIDSDELYPVYSVVGSDRKYGEDVEVDADDLARWDAATAAFHAAQAEMAEAWGQAVAARTAEHGRRVYYDGVAYDERP